VEPEVHPGKGSWRLELGLGVGQPAGSAFPCPADARQPCSRLGPVLEAANEMVEAPILQCLVKDRRRLAQGHRPTPPTPSLRGSASTVSRSTSVTVTSWRSTARDRLPWPSSGRRGRGPKAPLSGRQARRGRSPPRSR
jgi:hypothetical protein